MRIKIFHAVITISFILLLAGLFHTQIIEGAYYKKRSEDNRIVVIPIEAPRGKIFDRNGKVIVDNRISFDVSVIYKDAIDFRKLVLYLSDTLDVDKGALMSDMKRAKARPFAPTILLEDVGKTNAIILEQNRIDYPGLVISTRPRRNYLYGREVSAITGYLGKIREDELNKFKTYGYSVRDFIGRSGLEEQYDHYLRGVRGGMQVETDNRGRQTRVLHVKEPEPGRDLHLTIDIDLQKYCDEVMGRKNGAIIAMRPASGEILAFVSKPNFDANIFVTPTKGKEVMDVLNNAEGDYPLLNRGISCAYPPGSVFKVVIGISGLESGRLSVNDTFECPGYFTLGKKVYRCWYEKGHGTQMLEEAIKNSCNAFFYQAGLKIGPDNISQYAERFGFGKATGIDLPNETTGLLPSQRWKRAAKKEAWYPGDTVNFSIGQGYLLATPLQVVRMMAAIANGGYMVRPYLVSKIDDVSVAEPERIAMGISGDSLGVVKEGLIRVVNDPHGTGMKAKMEDVVVAGKTGTAQNPQGKAHGWFAAFAPAQDPKICLVVFVEFGGKGGVEASKIAKEVLTKSKELGLL